VKGVNLHFWIGGDPQRPPVLLWHGFLGTGYTWRKVMTRLAQRGFSVLVPGHARLWGLGQALG
jgi:alpha-beta hydrolase superfamily lysophospholipase